MLILTLNFLEPLRKSARISCINMRKASLERPISRDSFDLSQDEVSKQFVDDLVKMEIADSILRLGEELSPTFVTVTPPNSLGMVTAPAAVEAVIVAPPFSTM